MSLSLIVHTLGHAAAGRMRDLWRDATRRPRKLRIGVDIRPFYEPLTGIGWYLYFLLHEFAKHDDVELILLGDARITELGPRLHADLPANAKMLVFDLRGQPQSRLARPMTAAAYVAWMKLANCDVVFGSNYFLPRLHSAIARRRVVTVHDLSFERDPHVMGRRDRFVFRTVVPRSVRVAEAPSEVHRGGILHRTGHPHTLVRIPPRLGRRTRTLVCDAIDPSF